MINGKLEKGEIVVCVINGKSSLTLFKEYKIKDHSYGEILILNDNLEEFYYNTIRFIRKSDFREIKINKILNN